MNSFWRHVRKTPGPCWLWTGPMSVRLPDGKCGHPRRLAWIVEHVMAPIGKRVIHKGPSVGGYCVRPLHLCLGGTCAIQDEFSDLDLSRERKRQMRKIASGLCSISGCDKLLLTASHCRTHAIDSREACRKRQGSVRRNKSLSYG